MTYVSIRIEDGEYIREVDGEEVERRPAESWELPVVDPDPQV